VLNGGLTSLADAEAQLVHVDGVMLGRAAYHDPYVLAGVDTRLFDDIAPAPSRADVIVKMGRYLERAAANGISARAVTGHMLGLYHGQANARLWRRKLSDPAFLTQHGAATLRAAEAVFAMTV
jgi:tRNA-dihydrouridine synthase A